MVALKPPEADKLIARPEGVTGVVLIFGPDAGLVAERGQALVKAVTKGDSDPFSLVRLEGSDIAADPLRLVDEARTIGLFGGRRTIWVRDVGGRTLAAVSSALETLIDDPPEGALVVIEAGDLKKGTGIRKRVEEDRHARAIPCYADTARDLSDLITAETKAAGLAIDEEARQALLMLLGGDRRASRAEVEKLCLYAAGTERIRLADVEAIVGDVSVTAVDDAVDAALGGDLPGLDQALTRLMSAGTNPSVLAASALRHIQMLARARAEIDAGQTAERVLDRVQPPVFFRRKPLVLAALSVWSTARLETAAQRMDEAVFLARRLPALGAEIVADTLITVARAARRK